MEVSAVIGAFIGGAASTYLFHRPSFNIQGLKVLGKGGLQGAIVQTAAIGCAFIAQNGAEFLGSKTNWDRKKKTNLNYSFFFGGYALTGVIGTVVAKVLMHRISIPISYKEAFCNFGMSLVGGLIWLVVNED